MGRLIGNTAFTGTVDGLSFYHNKVHGILVRRKWGASKKKILNDPAYINTRRQLTEFASVASDNKLIRTGLRPLLVKEALLVSRLQGKLWEVLKSDKKSTWGERQLHKALFTTAGRKILEGYEFFSRSQLSNLLRIQANENDIVISPQKSRKTMNPRSKHPHLALTVACLGLNFTTKKCQLDCTDPLIYYSRSDRSGVSIPITRSEKVWPYYFIVLRVQVVQKTENGMLIRNDEQGFLRLLKINA